MKYYEGKNTGKGFITHDDNEVGYIQDCGYDIWKPIIGDGLISEV